MQIVLLVFAILSVVGAFPLIVATIVGVSMAIPNGPVSHSPAMQATLGVIAIVVVGIGAAGIIIRTTDAHVAHLPPPVRFVTVYRHKAQRWIWRVVVYELIDAGAALVLPSSWAWLPLGWVDSSFWGAVPC
jgi:hypothetical protein